MLECKHHASKVATPRHKEIDGGHLTCQSGTGSIWYLASECLSVPSSLSGRHSFKTRMLGLSSCASSQARCHTLSILDIREVDYLS